MNHGSGWDLVGTAAPGVLSLLPAQLDSFLLRKADKNKDNKMSFKELQNFLKELNIQVDDSYARKIFKVRDEEAWAGSAWQCVWNTAWDLL